MNIYFFLLFLFFLFYLFIINKNLNIYHFYEPPNIILFVLIFYFFQRIIYLFLTKDHYFIHFQFEYIFALIYSFIFLIIFISSYILVDKLIPNYIFNINEKKIYFNLDLIYIFALVSLYLFFQIIDDGYYWGISYDVNGTQLFFAKFLGLISTFYFIYKIFKTKLISTKIINFLFILLFILMFIMIGEKKNLLFIFLSFLIIYSNFIFKISYLHFFLIVTLLLLMFIFIVGPFFTIYREIVIQELGFNFNDIISVYKDYYINSNNNLFQRMNRLAGIDLLAAMLIESDLLDLKINNTYSKFFLSLIPSFIYPEKFYVLNSGEISNMTTFGRRFYSDSIFSPIVEAYYNLNVIGIFLVPLLISPILCIFFKIFNLFRNINFIYLILIFIFTKNFIIFEIEFGIMLSAFIKDVFIITVLLFLIYYASNFFRFHKS